MQPVRLLLPALHRSGLALLLLIALARCADGDDAPTGIDCSLTHFVPLELALGTGDPELTTFEPIPADGRVDLYPGIQGGYHAYMQLRARGLCPNRIVFSRKIREAEQGSVIHSQTERMPMVDAGDGWWILPRAQPTFICPSNIPGVAVAGRELDLEVTLAEDLRDSDAAQLPDGNRTLTQHFTVLPTCAPTDTVCSESTERGCAAPPE